MKFLIACLLLILVTTGLQAQVICQENTELRYLPFKSDLELMMEPGVEIVGFKNTVEQWYEAYCSASAGEREQLRVLVKKRRTFEVREVAVNCSSHGTEEKLVRCYWGRFSTVESYTR